ncbi:MAG: TrpB-like pyridoxal phosphate-dependent enzyme [Methylocystaceae bacterium]
MSRDERRVYLPMDRIPRFWYNAQADLAQPLLPSLDPQTKKPVTPEAMKGLFASALVEQEVSTERYIEIPEAVRELYSMYRPTPLIRAIGLEKALDTPAEIYYKYEGVSPVGSHKLNSALPQAYYNKIEGKTRLATETGAGQWGTALAFACAHFDLECMVYMVKVSYQQKPYRRSQMMLYGAKVEASPSNLTEAGRQHLAEYPHSAGSLGLAISEAVEDTISRDDTNYVLGSVLNHVVLHQSVIGLETKEALEMLGVKPDVVIGCCGGGSNFGGMAFPFLPDKLKGENIRLLAVEPAACPTLTRGVFAYDYGDVAGMTPISPMYTLGHAFMPSPIHAGGLRYHGASPLLSQLYKDGLVEAVAYNQMQAFEAAMQFAHHEGIVPAPESSHAIKATIDEAIRCRESGQKKVIVFCLSGHGLLDLASYDKYLSQEICDCALTDEDIQKGISQLPEIDLSVI